MSDPKREIVHVHRLGGGTKLLLAALVLALAANLFAPFFQARETSAQIGGRLGVMSMICDGTLPEHGATLKLNCTGTQL
ncbi:MAG: hypothetical protein O7B79_11620 [SAR324 cluster bacterium]|nr:hypothetical protein [SAR324 cluster bacterium]